MNRDLFFERWQTLSTEALEIEGILPGGWLSPREAAACAAAAEIAEGPVIELGAYAGRSTIALARGASRRPDGIVISIDTFEGWFHSPQKSLSTLDQYREALNGSEYAGRVIPFRATFKDVARQWMRTVDFILHDGMHYFDNVLEDVRDWGPYLRKGGMIAFHDYHPEFPGVVEAVEYLEQHGYSRVVLVDTLMFMEKLA